MNLVFFVSSGGYFFKKSGATRDHLTGDEMIRVRLTQVLNLQGPFKVGSCDKWSDMGSL